MNITTLLKAVNYDNNRIVFTDYKESYFLNKLKGVSLDSKIFAIFDQETSQVYYVYATSGFKPLFHFIEDWPNKCNTESVSEKEILRVIQTNLEKEPDEYIDFEMDSDVLAGIDKLAADVDITRNAMLIKVLTEYAKKVLEKENVS